MRLLILFTLCVTLGGCVPSVMRVASPIDADTVWQGRVEIAGDVEISPEAKHTILRGTEVIFLPPKDGEDRYIDHPHFPGSELIVHGRLTAEGILEAPIHFRAADPKASAGSWGGINLVKSPEASFRFCRFTQADSAIHSQESQVSIEESIFERNKVGVRFHSSAILVEHNLFRDNGAAIRFHFGAPVICKNVLINNGKGIFITAHPREYHIEANNFVNNRDWTVVLGEEVPEDVSLRRNFWGTTEIAKIIDHFFDGRREKHLGIIDIEPINDSPSPMAGPAWNP
ncbi:MAG: hypothetical protein C0621_02400 [Desulfuromonas sp.]|nr:MAG: hypothetical protein C0621_02400 [Desulfuromonas sp.]